MIGGERAMLWEGRWVVKCVLLSMLLVAVVLYCLRSCVGQCESFLCVLVKFIVILVTKLHRVNLSPSSRGCRCSFRRCCRDARVNVMRPSFALVSTILGMFASGMRLLFLICTFLNIGVGLCTFGGGLRYVFIPVVLCVDFCFMLRRVARVETKIISTLFLLTICCVTGGRGEGTLLLVVIKSFFRCSSLTLLPALVFNGGGFGHGRGVVVTLLVPLDCLVCFNNVDVLLGASVPLVNGGLTVCRRTVRGKGVAMGVGIFSPMRLISIVLFCCALCFQGAVATFGRGCGIMVGVITLKLFLRADLTFLPILTLEVDRLCYVIGVFLFSKVMCAFGRG